MPVVAITKGRSGNTQGGADIVDEVLHVRLVFGGKSRGDTVVPALVPTESGNLVAVGRIVSREVGRDVGHRIDDEVEHLLVVEPFIAGSDRRIECSNRNLAGGSRSAGSCRPMPS